MSTLSKIPKSGLYGDAVDALNDNFTKIAQSLVEGFSLYDVWIEAGNEGTIDQFLEAMRGEDGTYIDPEYTNIFNALSDLTGKTTTEKHGMLPEGNVVEEIVTGYETADALKLDKSALFDALSSLDGKTVAEKALMVPDGNVVEEVVAAAEDAVKRYITNDWTFTSGRKISRAGVMLLGQSGYKVSAPVFVKKGSVIHASSHGVAAIISKVNEGTSAADIKTILPMGDMNVEELTEFVCTAYEDMWIAVCGMSDLEAYVENVGDVEHDYLTNYERTLYTKEEVPLRMSGKPIALNTGDIAVLVNRGYNTGLVQAVEEDGTAIRTLWRPTESHDFTPYVYRKTEDDGVDYISMDVSEGASIAWGYILRKITDRELTLDDGVFLDEYDTYDAEGCTMFASTKINPQGNYDTSSVGVRSTVYQFENVGYASVYVRGYAYSELIALSDNFVIAFYDGEPSSATLIGWQSKNWMEEEATNMSGPWEFTALVPDDAVYVCVAFNQQYFDKDIRLYKKKVLAVKNDIVANFKERYYEDFLSMAYRHNAVEYKNAGKFDYAKAHLKLLFYTDCHSDVAALLRAMELAEYMYGEGLLDCTLSGGDNAQEADYSYSWFNNALARSSVDGLVAVGNHDASTRWKATKELAYTNNIAPMMERVDDIVTADDAAEEYRFYYYKDYSTVRVIVLYTPVNDDTAFADDTQLDWFKDVLAQSITDGKHVVVCNHYMYNGAYKHNYGSASAFFSSNPNTFLTPYAKGFLGNGSQSTPNANYTLPTDFLLAVKDFEDAGGVFVCWLTGHEHADNFMDVEDHATYGYQPMFNAASCSARYSARDFVRKRGEASMDCLTYVTVDTEKMMLKFLRIGCNIDTYGRSRRVLGYHYGAHMIIYNR